jgi:prophage regulatory protein
MQNCFIRFPSVKKTTGLSRVTIWRLERDNKFPPRRQLSANAVGWLQSEIDAWVTSRNLVSTGQADQPRRAVV